MYPYLKKQKKGNFHTNKGKRKKRTLTIRYVCSITPTFDRTNGEDIDGKIK
jgi:hypothetical protein